MYTILIVDDEKAIVEGLNMIISRGMDNCKVVGMAYDCDQGFDKAMELQPDIVVTDIRMLKGDGLDMIAQLKEAGNASKFIILSGYASFEYAKRGMSLGARFYLNKPVEEEELFECLRLAMQDVEQERTQSTAIERMRKTYATAIEDMQDVILRDVLDSEPKDAWLTVDRLDAVGFPVSGTHYACALAELYEERESQDDGAVEAALHGLRDWEAGKDGLRIVQYGQSQLAVVAYGKNTANERMLLQTFQGMQRDLAERTGLRISIGIGLIYEDFHGIVKSFAEAREALNYRIIKGLYAVVPYSEVQARLGHAAAQIAESDLMKLEACLDHLDIEGASAIVRSIFTAMTENGELSLSHLQYQCMSMLFCGMRKLTPAQFKSGDWLQHNLLSLDRLAQFRSLEQLREWILQALRELISLRAIGSNQPKKDVIADVKRYIADHYDQNISLADLSSRVYLYPDYLSNLFK